MATNTYVALRQTTITGSPTSSVTFDLTGITGYTDLVAVINAKVSASSYDLSFRLNSDTGSNYSWTTVSGNGSIVSTTRGSNLTAGRADYRAYMDTTNFNTYILNFMNYSNATTYKNVLVRGNSAALGTDGLVNLWRNTNAITSIVFAPEFTGNFAVGSTFSLYGIAAEGTTPAVKATGGTIYSDSLYYYHVFGSTGTFTPSVSLSAEVLVVAGGGGGGGNIAGGGGAGGLRNGTLSLSATAYAVTIGAGGNKGTGNNTDCTSGSNSVFSTITSAGGGRGASDNAAVPAATGGSGGGGSWSLKTGAAGNTPSTSPSQGNSGGNTEATSFASCGGGGGANGTGENGSTTVNAGGNGGVGSSTYSSWGFVTGVGQLVQGVYYLAGGGGGGRSRVGTSAGALGGFGGGGVGGFDGTATPNVGTVGGDGFVNTGGGGGGAAWGSAQNGGNGGSGVVIVRYLKA